MIGKLIDAIWTEGGIIAKYQQDGETYCVVISDEIVGCGKFQPEIDAAVETVNQFVCGDKLNIEN